MILAALPDLLDGALAKASDTASQRGAFFDSTVDRITDALLLGGIAWYFASEESPHMALLPFAVMAVSSLISYQRAKAESLGIDAKGGLMERAERIIAICLGLLIPRAADPDPVDHARAHLDHGDPAVRQGLEAGGGRSGHRRADRDASVAAPEPPGGAHRAAPHPGAASADLSRAVATDHRSAPVRRPGDDVVVPVRRGCGTADAGPRRPPG